jgi:hypothetical protein
MENRMSVEGFKNFLCWYDKKRRILGDIEGDNTFPVGLFKSENKELKKLNPF